MRLSDQTGCIWLVNPFGVIIAKSTSHWIFLDSSYLIMCIVTRVMGKPLFFLNLWSNNFISFFCVAFGVYIDQFISLLPTGGKEKRVEIYLNKKLKNFLWINLHFKKKKKIFMLNTPYLIVQGQHATMLVGLSLAVDTVRFRCWSPCFEFLFMF